MWDTSVVFKQLPKVNNRPLGENLANLVTLMRPKKLPDHATCVWSFDHATCIGCAHQNKGLFTPTLTFLFQVRPGLPDFTWYNLPKRKKIYQITVKYTKWPQNILNSRKIPGPNGQII
jgi:hypothetical protein